MDELIQTRLNELIAKQGSQKSAAALLGISEAQMSRILAGLREPSAEVLRRLGLRIVIVPIERN